MTPGYISDAPPFVPPPPTRTNDQLNLSVLQRHNPLITSILAIAPFAVVYHFPATTGAWEKTGVEGSLFVCSMRPEGEVESYCVIVLNRRGMENFCVGVGPTDDVEVGEEFVFLRVNSDEDRDRDEEGMEGEGQKSYGLWIFSEDGTSTADTRAVIGNVIVQCAASAQESRERAQTGQNGHGDENVFAGGGENVGTEMGRQMSLKEIFGAQRAMDDEWSVKVHSPETLTARVAEASGSSSQEQQGRDVLGDLFRRATVGQQGGV
jgi:hypothetical protein